MYFISLCGIAIAIFVSTNIDNLCLLTALFADPLIKTRTIVAGQFLGLGLLYCFSVIAALSSIFVPVPWTGLLGIIPLFLGVRGVIALFKARTKKQSTPLSQDQKNLQKQTPSEILTIAGLAISSGADNLGAYIPLFAKNKSEIAFYILIFAVMTGLWCMIAHHLVRNRWVGRYVEKYGEIALPFILIGLAIYILNDARPLLLLSFP